jgi:hypothetical protein
LQRSFIGGDGFGVKAAQADHSRKLPDMVDVIIPKTV